jgi:hypothetical protein
MDNRLDIIVANDHTDNVGVIVGYGNGSFKNETTLSTGSTSLPFSISAGDFNNENYLDIAVANYGTNNMGVFFGNDNRTFASETTIGTGDESSPISVAAAYFNKKNWLNLVVANNGSDNVGVFVGQNQYTFGSEMTYSTGTGSYPYSVAVGDLNNDNRFDIVFTNLYDGNVSVLLGHGNGTFTTQATYSTEFGSDFCSVRVGDFNDDNRLDLDMHQFQS